MNPNIWGKYYWIVIHLTALGYPENPTQNEKDIYKNFYKNFGQILPCSKCSKNYERHWQNLPIELFLENRNNLFKWTVQLHNIVNKELGKKQWSMEFANAYYKNFEEYSSIHQNPFVHNNHAQNKLQSILMISLNIFVILILIAVLWVKYKQK